jgi:hypothetical protein
METSSKICKIILVFTAIILSPGCELHAHALGGNGRHHYIHEQYSVYENVCDDPEVDPFSFEPLYCEEYENALCCTWEIAYYRHETYCLYEDSCAWEYDGSHEF